MRYASGGGDIAERDTSRCDPARGASNLSSVEFHLCAEAGDQGFGGEAYG